MIKLKTLQDFEDDEINIINIKDEYINKVCPCCGKEFSLLRTVDQPVCDKCFAIAVKELFRKENDGLKILDFKEKVKGMVR